MARFEDRYTALQQSGFYSSPLDAAAIEVARRYVSSRNEPPCGAKPDASYQLTDGMARWTLGVYVKTQGPCAVVVHVDGRSLVCWEDQRRFVELVTDFTNQSTLRQQARGHLTHVEAIVQRAKLMAYELGLNAPIDFHPSSPPARFRADEDRSEVRLKEIRACNRHRDAYKRAMMAGGPNGYR